MSFYNPITYTIHPIDILYVYLHSIFLGPAVNDSLPDYDIIEETDPYYWSINEFDMLSSFNHEIADQAAFADTMTSPASGSPPTPVMCAQKSLDYTEFAKNRMIECISDMKPVYRKTPVPKRKLTRISESVTVSPSSSNLPHVHS